MENNKKMIRYVAYGLAGFIIISIFSTIISVASIIISTFSNDEYLVEMHELEEFNTINEIEDLKINLSTTELIIIDGDKFKLETNNKNVSFSIDHNNVEIKEKNHHKIFNIQRGSKLILTIPQNYEFKNMEFDLGVSLTKITNLNLDAGNFDLGTGKVIISSLNVKDHIHIDSGVGKVEIKDGNIHNLDLSMGVGNVDVTAYLTGRNQIDGGGGSLNLNLLSNLEDYKITLDKGVGNCRVNDLKLDDNTIGNGKNLITVDGGVGNIIIRTSK